MVASSPKPPQPARKLLIPIIIRVGNGRSSPGPNRPRKICSNCGITTIIITAKTAGNIIVEDAILKVRAGVERGESFVEPLKATDVFPHMVGQMVGVGEQTGALDAMLGKIADFYEDEVDTAIADLLALIEPVLIAFLGITIGSIVISMYLPLFTLIGKLSGGGK